MAWLIEFADCAIDAEEINAGWEIRENCLICQGNGESDNMVIPLHNILRMTETWE